MKFDSSYLSKRLSYLFDEKRYLFYLFLITGLVDDASSSTNEVNRHLEKGMELLARGQFGDALSHYHAAIDGDPKNYLTYFKRATVYLAIGKPKAALDDLNEVLELKDDFSPARSQRGNLLLKLGRIDEAHIDLESVLRDDPHNLDALNQYNLIEHLKVDFQNLDLYLQDHSWPEAIAILTKLIQDLPYSSKLRELRSECFEHVGNKQNAIADLTVSTKMNNDDTVGYFKLSKLHYEIGEIEESLKKIRECLKLNPDHKECMTHYRKVKNLYNHFKAMNDHSQNEEFNECIERADRALKVESTVNTIIQQLMAKKCHCANKGRDSNEAIQMCTEALKYDQNDVNVLCDRAEAHLNADEFEEAEADFHKAANIDPQLSRAKEGLKKAQNIAKQRSKRDYYKILDVRRSASKREIMKAYRKLAAKWHPDNYTDEKEKAKAEKLFIDVARAKEVLTDDEKRKKFDMGIDPLDSEAQQHAHHHGGGGFPFHFDSFDSPFVFKFNFN